jgi:hypothetical protein
VREHDDDVAVADEVDGLVDRFEVALAAPHLESAAGADDRPQRPPEQLRLGHEAQVALRKERDPQRPGIEVRDVVRGEHEASVLRDILDTLGPEPERSLDERPGQEADEAVEGAGPHAAKYLRPAVLPRTD